MRAGIKLETEPVGQSREVIENPHNVSDLKAGLVVKAERAQRLPVVLSHAGRRLTQFIGHSAQRSFTPGEAGDVVPAPCFNRFDQPWMPVFNTQKLCVRLGSIVAVLG